MGFTSAVWKRLWRKEKEAKKGLQLRTGKQTGSLFYLCGAIAKNKTKKKNYRKWDEVESEMGGFSTVLAFLLAHTCWNLAVHSKTEILQRRYIFRGTVFLFSILKAYDYTRLEKINYLVWFLSRLLFYQQNPRKEFQFIFQVQVCRIVRHLY